VKYDYFISTRWRNRDIALEITKKLREKGKKIYCFFENSHAAKHANENPEEFMKKFESTKNWKKNKYVNAIFKEDMLGLKNSKALIMLLPGGKSTHVEAGIAYGLNKKCILIGEAQETESLYLIFNEFYPTIASFIKTL
jgi:hypothetical protein